MSPAFCHRDAGLVPLRRGADLALLIVTFGERHLGNADFLSPAFRGRDVGLVFLRRDMDLASLSVAFKR